MVWSPMAGGLLSGKYGPGAPGNGEGRRAAFNFPPVNEDRAWAAVAVMREIAEKHDVSVATVALGYVLAKPFVMSVIIGASRMEQLEQNLAATELKLDADDLAKLDEVSALPAEYPGWMLERQGAGRRPAPFSAEELARRRSVISGSRVAPEMLSGSCRTLSTRKSRKARTRAGRCLPWPT